MGCEGEIVLRVAAEGGFGVLLFDPSASLRWDVQFVCEGATDVFPAEDDVWLNGDDDDDCEICRVNDDVNKSRIHSDGGGCDGDDDESGCLSGRADFCVSDDDYDYDYGYGYGYSDSDQNDCDAYVIWTVWGNYALCGLAHGKYSILCRTMIDFHGDGP